MRMAPALSSGKQKLLELPVRGPIHQPLRRGRANVELNDRYLHPTAFLQTRHANVGDRPERVERSLRRGDLVRREIHVEVRRNGRSVDAPLLELREEFLRRVERRETVDGRNLAGLRQELGE